MHKQHLLMGMFAFLSSVMCTLKYRPECSVKYAFSSTNPTIYVSSNVSFWRCSYCLSNSTGGCSNHMCRAQNDYGKEIKLLLKVETKQWKNRKFCPRFWLNVGMIEGRGGWGGGLKTLCICKWCYMHYCMMHTHFYPLQEMRFLTKRLRDKDEEDVVVGDWKFAAMVIDRCADSMLQFVLYDLWEYVWALISMIPLEWCVILESMYHYYFHWNVHWERLTIID